MTNNTVFTAVEIRNTVLITILYTVGVHPSELWKGNDPEHLWWGHQPLKISFEAGRYTLQKLFNDCIINMSKTKGSFLPQESGTAVSKVQPKSKKQKSKSKKQNMPLRYGYTQPPLFFTPDKHYMRRIKLGSRWHQSSFAYVFKALIVKMLVIASSIEKEIKRWGQGGMVASVSVARRG